MTAPVAPRPTLLLATQNEKKRKELAALAEGVFTVRTLGDVGLAALEIVEDAETFAGNAAKKARTVADALAPAARAAVFAVLADDSGLAVDALAGAPGVRSARFARDHGAGEGDLDNNALLLARLHDVDDARRTARFVCFVAALVLDDGALLTAEGAVEGRIARAPTGAGGFGYDPLFLPDRAPGRTMAELSSDEKHAISHRGHAMRAIVDALQAHRAAR